MTEQHNEYGAWEINLLHARCNKLRVRLEKAEQRSKDAIAIAGSTFIVILLMLLVKWL